MISSFCVSAKKLQSFCLIIMTGDISVLTVIARHRQSPHVRAGEVVVADEGKSVPSIDSDPVPDVVARKDVAARPEHPVDGVVTRRDGVGNGERVLVGRDLDALHLRTPHLKQEF